MSEKPDFTYHADEIERHFDNLKSRMSSVIRQLRAGKTMGEEDLSAVATRCRTLGEAIDRADARTLAVIRERQAEAMRKA